MTIKVASAQTLLTIFALKQNAQKQKVPIHCRSLHQPKVLETIYTCLHTHECRLTGDKSGAWASPNDEASEIFFGLNGVFWPVL
jgi:hypothetical protein